MAGHIRSKYRDSGLVPCSSALHTRLRHCFRRPCNNCYMYFSISLDLCICGLLIREPGRNSNLNCSMGLLPDPECSVHITGSWKADRLRCRHTHELSVPRQTRSLVCVDRHKSNCTLGDWSFMSTDSSSQRLRFLESNVKIGNMGILRSCSHSTLCCVVSSGLIQLTIDTGGCCGGLSGRRLDRSPPSHACNARLRRRTGR